MPLLLGWGQRLLAGLTNGSRDAVWLLRLDPRRSGTHFVHRKLWIGELCLTLNCSTCPRLLVSRKLPGGETEELVVPDPRL